MDINVVSWDGHDINDGANYVTVMPAYPLFPAHAVQVVERGNTLPLLAAPSPEALKFSLYISIENAASGKALTTQLAQWFNPRDGQSKQLIIEDDDGANDRYIMARCVSLTPLPQRGRLQWKAELIVDGLGDPDGRFRTAVETGDTWLITASGDTNTIDNQGEDDAYPVFTIKPTAARTAGYQKKRFVSVIWNAAKSAAAYPICVTGDAGFDTASEVSGGDMQADGDDLRVLVDGFEVDRWLADMNTAATKVWANLDFSAGQSFTLLEDIGSGDDVTEIQVEESVLPMPYAGILQINNEIFTYTGKNNTDQLFSGVKRAQKGTSAAAHTAGDTIYWVQHDIWMLYDNSAASAPVIVDEDKEPVFEMDASDNSRRYFDYFGQAGSGPTGGPDPTDRWIEVITEVRGLDGMIGEPIASTPPWEQIVAVYYGGSGDRHHKGHWLYKNPCGISTVEAAGTTTVTMPSFSIGTWRTVLDLWAVDDTSGYLAEIPTDTEPSGNGSNIPWDTAAEAMPDGTMGVLFGVDKSYNSGSLSPFDIVYRLQTIDIDLNTDYTPAVAVGGEQVNYDLEATLVNNTTGISISVAMHAMDLDEELEINTDGKTVIYLKDGSGQIGQLTLDSGVRRDWLKLAPGENELEYTEEGAQGVTLTTQYNMRWYS